MSEIVPVEEARRGREPYEALIQRLSHQSVVKRFEAYRDVEWENPEFHVDPADPRWALTQADPLGGTSWYQALPVADQARLGCYRLATFMKVGLQFENILSQGLLKFALARPERTVEHRYAYHEIIEESHHSLIFAEFIRRTGFEVHGLTGFLGWLGERIANLGTRFPELFFVFVLGGEDPIDHAQRLALAEDRPLHPLMKRITQIHITEEARHLCFARSYLRENVPKLTPRKRAALMVAAPVILRVMGELMLRPAPAMVRQFAIPPEVVEEAFTKNPAYRQLTMDSLAKVRELMAELGLVTPASKRLWRALGAAA